jgi:hypothetical protein
VTSANSCPRPKRPASAPGNDVMIFVKYFRQKMKNKLAISTQITANFLVEKIIITLVFKKTGNFFDENGWKIEKNSDRNIEP